MMNYFFLVCVNDSDDATTTKTFSYTSFQFVIVCWGVGIQNLQNGISGPAQSVPLTLIIWPFKVIGCVGIIRDGVHVSCSIKYRLSQWSVCPPLHSPVALKPLDLLNKMKLVYALSPVCTVCTTWYGRPTCDPENEPWFEWGMLKIFVTMD